MEAKVETMVLKLGRHEGIWSARKPGTRQGLSRGGQEDPLFRGITSALQAQSQLMLIGFPGEHFPSLSAIPLRHPPLVSD